MLPGSCMREKTKKYQLFEIVFLLLKIHLRIDSKNYVSGFVKIRIFNSGQQNQRIFNSKRNEWRKQRFMLFVQLLLLQHSLASGLSRFRLCISVSSPSLPRGARRRLSVLFSECAQSSRQASVDSRSPPLDLWLSVCISRSRLSIFRFRLLSLFQNSNERECDAPARTRRVRATVTQ